MTRTVRLLLIAAFVLGAFFALSSSASAQPGYGQPQTINCSSNDGKRNWCNIGNARDAQLVRQISGSPCVRGSTWGIDNRGLWVDNGCRADFAIGGGGGYYPQPGPGQGTIRCSSDNGKRNWCNIGNARDARLVNQVSGSPCVRGSTWGIDNRGLWVDNGCRADFAIGGGGGNYPQPGSGQGTIRCSSDNGKRNWCNIGNARDAQLVNQVSGSPCVRGSTWGIDNRGLWVDNGCRADFAIGGGGGYYPQPGPGQGMVTCSSNNGKRNWCDIGNSRDVQLVRQISGSPCVRGNTWGIDQRGLWVDNGCRAEFRVR